MPPGLFLDWGPRLADGYLHGSVPELEYPRCQLPDGVEFVGALLPDGVDDWLPPAWWPDLAAARAAGRPVVVVRQGTVATEPGEAVRCPPIAALDRRDVLVVATTGGRDPDAVLPPSGSGRPNLRLERFVPFGELLPHARRRRRERRLRRRPGRARRRACRSSSPARSEDKMEVAARVAWSGAGIALKTDRPSPRRVERAVDAVLAEPSYRRRAGELRTAYARPGRPRALRRRRARGDRPP